MQSEATVPTSGEPATLEHAEMLRIQASEAPPVPDPFESLDAELLQKRRLLTVLMDSIVDHIYFKDRDSRFLLMSRSQAQRFGLSSPDEAIGKTDFDFFAEEHARQAFADEQAIMETGKPLLDRLEKETWPDGSVSWVSTTKMPLYADDGSVVGTFGVSRDVTARKLAEEELEKHQHRLEELVEERTRALSESNEQLEREIVERRRAEDALLEGERIETIRSMAGGVAMHFNNIIGVISSYASSISGSFIPKTRVHDQATRILEASNRAGELTRRLMDMAGASKPAEQAEREATSLAQTIEEATGFLEQVLQEKHVEVRVSKQERMPFVMADRRQLLDAVMSLLINASEAMAEGGGVIRIDALERIVKKPGSKNPDAEGGAFAVLRIRDTGVGIDANHLERIFEPFFTTKESSASFGLGLSFARSAVIGMGGWIGVRSRPGKGSSFDIFLPKAQCDVVEDDAEPDPEAVAGGTVLLVDDDLQALGAMQKALEGEGFRVLAADGLKQAVSLYTARSGTEAVDLTIVDSSLPAGAALAIVKRVRKDDPQAAFVLTSGFPRDYVRAQVPLGPWQFLQKPFEAEQLTDAAKKALLKAAGARVS